MFTIQIANNELTHFPSCEQLLTDIPNADLSIFVAILKTIIDEFNQRFKDFHKLSKEIALYANPMAANSADQKTELQLELCNLQADPVFSKRSLYGEEFYKCLPEKTYPKLYDFGLKMTSMFASSYICECTFSIMKTIKSDKRSQLSEESLENLIRLATTKISIDIKNIINKNESENEDESDE